MIFIKNDLDLIHVSRSTNIIIIMITNKILNSLINMKSGTANFYL